MRRIIASEFVSVDGVMQDPSGMGEIEHGGWTIPYWNDELEAYKREELFSAGGLLLGRFTYEGFASTWPDMSHEGDYADRMNTFPKYVVSRTLAELTWNNSHVLGGNLEKEVVSLKQRPGQDLIVFGSGDLVRSLLRLGLVDDLHLQLCPIVLGTGRQLFGRGDTPTPLQLTETKPLGPVVLLTYTAPSPS